MHLRESTEPPALEVDAVKDKWLAFTCGCFIALCATLGSVANAEPVQSRVLFIASYHPGFPTFFDQVDGLTSVLKSPAIKLDIEFMDAKRFDSPQLENIFYLNLKRKLELLPPYDLIITGDDAATHFAVDHHQDLFAHTPVVFFGVNDLAFARSLNSLSYITGVAERAAYRETVALINNLYPGGTIYLIDDNNLSARLDMERFDQEMQTLGFTRYQQLRLDKLSFEELIQQVRKLRAPATILLVSMYHDKTGTNLDFEHSLMVLHQAVQVPIFHLWPHGLGQGVLGGKLLSQKVQASAAALIGLRILQGADPRTIAVVMESPSRYMFDFHELQQFAINPAQLPASSEFINAPDPLYLRYRNYIYTAAVILVILAIALLVLLLQFRNRRQYQQKILLNNSHLELKVKARTAELATANADLKNLLQLHDSILDNSLVCIVLVKKRVIQWVNSFTETLFGYTAAELIGRDTQFIYKYIEDYHRVASEAIPVLLKGKNYISEYAYKRKDGKTLWCIVSARALNPANLDEGVVYIINDITQRKKAEENLLKLNEKLEQQATTDHLTGICNRRQMTQLLQSEIKRSNRYNSSFAIILIDIDHFKNLNDSYGHQTGDKVLKCLALLLKNNIRQVDTVARWGGEEFLILCPNSQLTSAEQLAELLRSRLAAYKFDVPIQVTASFGVAEFYASQNLDALVNAADSALYYAKEERNSVQIAPAPRPH